MEPTPLCSVAGCCIRRTPARSKAITKVVAWMLYALWGDTAVMLLQHPGGQEIAMDPYWRGETGRPPLVRMEVPYEIWADMQEEEGIDTALLRIFISNSVAIYGDTEASYTWGSGANRPGSGYYTWSDDFIFSEPNNHDMHGDHMSPYGNEAYIDNHGYGPPCGQGDGPW